MTPQSYLTFGLGATSTVPTFRDTPTSDWDCSLWVIWHKSLVAAFQAGAFASGLKYTQAKAIENANNVFTIHWNKTASFRNSNFCGYNSTFFTYFKTVGLTDILSYFQAIITPTAKAATEVVSSGAKSVENVAAAVENTSDLTKWLVPGIALTVSVALLFFGYQNYLKPQNHGTPTGE